MKRTSFAPQSKLKLVVIGNGPVGFKFCEKFLRYRLDKIYDLLVYGEENVPAYDRINLTRYFSVGSKEELLLANQSWYEKNRIVLKTGQPIVEINRQQKWVKSAFGAVQHYDKLIFATGSLPFIPVIDGVDLPSVFAYRTIGDLEAIKENFSTTRKVLVVGGGILGLEAARAFLGAGMETTVVEIAEHIMPKQLDAEGAAILKNNIEKLGVKILCNWQIRKIHGINRVESVEFSGGLVLPMDMVVFSAGIRPRDQLARSCGLKIGDRGGIVVNNFNLTSDDDIFAIGDCALALDKVWGLAAPGYEMAEVVASRLAKIYKVFTGNVLFTKLKILETALVCFGDQLGEKNAHVPIVRAEPRRGVYQRINISTDNRYVLGGILISDTNDYPSLIQMVRNRIRISGPIENLLNRQDKNLGITGEYAENQIICLCENVSRGKIVAAIRKYCLSNLDQVKKMTSAGIGCESCTDLIGEILVQINSTEKIADNED